MASAGEEEQDGLSRHSAGHAPPSSASSLPKEQSQVELEIKILEALEHYPPSRLQGTHRHFVLYGMMEYLRRSFDRDFSSEEVLQLLDRFFNLEMLVKYGGEWVEPRHMKISRGSSRATTRSEPKPCKRAQQRKISAEAKQVKHGATLTYGTK